MMIVGVVLSAGTTGSTSTTLIAVGVVFFLTGMWDIRKGREGKK